MLILLGTVLSVLYLGIFLLLLNYQRDLLFAGNSRVVHPPLPNSIYHARVIAEADGARLTIWEAPPRAGMPTFVIFYGNASSLTDFEQTGEHLHARGFGAVLASYRGYSGNLGRPSEDGLMADARAILAAVPRQWGPIVLWGHSLGSGVAARMASEGPGKALVLESAYTSVTDVAARRFPIYPVRWFMEDRFDTLSLVPRIKMPVLIMHGTEDPIVPFDMGVTLSQRFGREATFVPFLGVEHEPHRSDLTPIVAAWLQENAAALHLGRR